MRILVDSNILQYPQTGIGKVTVELYNACLEQLPLLHVDFVHEGNLQSPIPLGAQSIQVGKLFPSRVWRTIYLSVIGQLRGINVFHFPWNGQIPRLLSRAVIVTTLHDVLPLDIYDYFRSTSEEQRYRVSKQKDIDSTDLLITDSEYSKKRILDEFKVNFDPIVIYPAPCRANTNLSMNIEIKHPQNFFLYVGGYDRRKGLESLISAFIDLHRQNRLNSQLWLTGEPLYYSQRILDLIKEAKALKIVVERGYVSTEELNKLYSEAIALIYPSKYEGFGLPPLEAMALGCPVVTTKCTAIPEICGDAVLYVDPDNTSLAETILALTSNAELRSILQTKGLQRSRYFNWHDSARKFLDNLNKTIAFKLSQI